MDRNSRPNWDTSVFFPIGEDRAEWSPRWLVLADLLLRPDGINASDLGVLVADRSSEQSQDVTAMAKLQQADRSAGVCTPASLFRLSVPANWSNTSGVEPAIAGDLFHLAFARAVSNTQMALPTADEIRTNYSQVLELVTEIRQVFVEFEERKDFFHNHETKRLCELALNFEELKDVEIEQWLRLLCLSDWQGREMCELAHKLLWPGENKSSGSFKVDIDKVDSAITNAINHYEKWRSLADNQELLSAQPVFAFFDAAGDPRPDLCYFIPTSGIPQILTLDLKTGWQSLPKNRPKTRLLKEHGYADLVNARYGQASTELKILWIPTIVEADAALERSASPRTYIAWSHAGVTSWALIDQVSPPDNPNEITATILGEQPECSGSQGAYLHVLIVLLERTFPGRAKYTVECSHCDGLSMTATAVAETRVEIARRVENLSLQATLSVKSDFYPLMGPAVIGEQVPAGSVRMRVPSLEIWLTPEAHHKYGKNPYAHRCIEDLIARIENNRQDGTSNELSITKYGFYVERLSSTSYLVDSSKGA